MNQTTIQAEMLWAAGNFRDPDHPECHNVRKEDLPKLKATDPEFIGAVMSRQLYFQEQLDAYSLAVHGRLAISDGHPGPATDLLLTSPRCPHPDFYVSPEDDPALNALCAKPEEANWPTPCRENLITSRSFESLPGLTQEQTDGVWWAACHNWTDSIEDLKMTPGTVGKGDNAHLYADLRGLSGSTLAWSFLARNTCNVQLAQAYNSRTNWNLRLAATVKTHEDGHALGIDHQRDSSATMYPSITNASMSRYGYPNATDIKAMQALGYSPYTDWDRRKPPETKLFLPRDAGPEFLRDIVLRGTQGSERVFTLPVQIPFVDSHEALLEMLK